MAITYSAARANNATDRQVFSGGLDAVVAKVDDSQSSLGTVIAVAIDHTTAQAIAAALNGGS